MVTQKSTTRDEGQRTRNKRDQIDENLKRVYDETLNEPLPDRLSELLERLKKKESK